LSSNVQPVPVKMDIPIKGACLLIKISVAYLTSNTLGIGLEFIAELHAQQKNCVKRNFYNFKECFLASIDIYVQLRSGVFTVIVHVCNEFLKDKFCTVF
jgi:hypothetical protein